MEKHGSDLVVNPAPGLTRFESGADFLCVTDRTHWYPAPPVADNATQVATIYPSSSHLCMNYCIQCDALCCVCTLGSVETQLVAWRKVGRGGEVEN